MEIKLNPNFPDGTDPKNPIRIYSDGVFDCFHYGHANLFQKIKGMFPHVYLIAGVCLDEEIDNHKGMHIMNSFQRKECVKHCKWVDEIVDGPWYPDVAFLDKINAHYIAHDPEPYPAPGTDDVYGEFKVNSRFLPTTRTEGISTTDIINNVLFNYDEYVHRAIRKKTPLSELNLSAVDYLKYKFTEIGHSIKDEVIKLAKSVEEQEEKEESKVLIKEFLKSV